MDAAIFVHFFIMEPTVVLFVSPCSLFAVLSSVRVFAVRCSHACDCTDTSCLLYATLQWQQRIEFRRSARKLRRRQESKVLDSHNSNIG
jgi:hypothetical protein